MSASARLSLVDRAECVVPITRQCQLLKVARSTLYHRQMPVSADDLLVRRHLDEHYLATPFYGTRRMVIALERQGLMVNRKRVRRLMRLIPMAQ